jgi:Zinc-finger domain
VHWRIAAPGSPHVYLDMGEDETIRCPYCATVFRFDARLDPGDAIPSDCLFIDELGE